jgi:hypothetical protein
MSFLRLLQLLRLARKTAESVTFAEELEVKKIEKNLGLVWATIPRM